MAKEKTADFKLKMPKKLHAEYKFRAIRMSLKKKISMHDVIIKVLEDN